MEKLRSLLHRVRYRHEKLANIHSSKRATPKKEKEEEAEEEEEEEEEGEGEKQEEEQSEDE